MNTEKVALRHRAQRQVVTGLVVNEKVNVPRTLVRQVRAMIHAWETHGYAAAAAEFLNRWDRNGVNRYPPSAAEAERFRWVVAGKANYIGMIRGKDDALVVGIWRRIAKLDSRFSKRVVPPRQSDWHERSLGAMWVVESGMQQGTAFSVGNHGLLTCDHVVGDSVLVYRAPNGTRIPATVIGRCPRRDLALLRVDQDGPSLGLARSHETLLGSEVRVAGFPNQGPSGGGHFTTQNVAGHYVRSMVPRVMLTGPIGPGMSGGPVLNASCDVIEVIVTGADRLEVADESEKHGFLPLGEVREFLDEQQHKT